MPYITQDRRAAYHDTKDQRYGTLGIETPGDLNYLITSALLIGEPTIENDIAALLKQYYSSPREFNYQTINDVIGAIVGAGMEYERRMKRPTPKVIEKVLKTFYDKMAAPYEDRKIKANGDVYPVE